MTLSKQTLRLPGSLPPPPQRWFCDFCVSTFDTKAEAADHERGCEERNASVTLLHEPRKNLGLVLTDEVVPELSADGESNLPTVVVSESSPLFVENIRAVHTVAGSLFPLDVTYEESDEEGSQQSSESDNDGTESEEDEGAESQSEDEGAESQSEDGGATSEEDDGTAAERNRDDEGSDNEANEEDTASEEEGSTSENHHEWLDGLREFSKRHLRLLNIPKGTPRINMHAGNRMNSSALTAVVEGFIWPGGIIKEVKYTKNKAGALQRLGTAERCISSQEVTQILSRKNCYPIELTLQRRHVNPQNIHDRWYGLPKLDLSNSTLFDIIQWEHFSDGLCQFTQLRQLVLDGNSLGRQGCTALVPLLRMDDSVLVLISLNNCQLDDKCIKILSKGLRGNGSTKQLLIADNELSLAGWRLMCRLLCDRRSVDATYNSNHMLRDLGVDIHQLAEKYHDQGSQNGPYLFQRLGEMLRVNSRATRTAPASLKKIRTVHFNRWHPFDCKQFMEWGLALKPHLISWIGRKSATFTDGPLRFVFRLVRHMNLEELFGNPSLERQRIGLRIAELERKNAELEASVAELKAGVGINSEPSLEETSKVLESIVARLKEAGPMIEMLEAQNSKLTQENESAKEKLRVINEISGSGEDGDQIAADPKAPSQPVRQDGNTRETGLETTAKELEGIAARVKLEGSKMAALEEENSGLKKEHGLVTDKLKIIGEICRAQEGNFGAEGVEDAEGTESDRCSKKRRVE